jgi:hypothetical protein
MGTFPARQKPSKYRPWMDINIDLLGGLGKKSKCNTTVSNVLFEDITITGGQHAGQMFGSGECEIANVTMKNVRLGGGAAALKFGACTVQGGCASARSPRAPRALPAGRTCERVDGSTTDGHDGILN